MASLGHNEFMQNCSNSSALAVELLQSCTKPLECSLKIMSVFLKIVSVSDLISPDFQLWCRNHSWVWAPPMRAGLGRVPDLWVRVQVRVLVICMTTSMSTWLLHEYEYKYEYCLMSTSTGLWSTFYINSSIAFFCLWKGDPQILINLGQSYNFPLSM